MFAPQPGIPDWTKREPDSDPCIHGCLMDGLNYPECPVHGEAPISTIKAAAQQGALITGESPEVVEEAILMMVAKPTQPLITDDPRPRCGDQYTVPQKFGRSFVVTCNKYEGHTDPGNNRTSRRHWNVQHRTGWFTRPASPTEQDGQAN